MATTSGVLKISAVLICTGFSLSAAARLPPLTAEQRAKANEAAARAAWSDKVGTFQLCKAQDAVAARYFSELRQAGKEAKAPMASGTCADPGNFAYTEPTSAPPLEASGAHSPATTAVGPPSSTATQAEKQGSPKR